MSDIVVRPNQPPSIVISGGQSSIPMVSMPTQSVGITVPVGKPGPPGPPGNDAQWESMTQAEYNALSDPDPNTLYVITP